MLPSSTVPTFCTPAPTFRRPSGLASASSRRLPFRSSSSSNSSARIPPSCTIAPKAPSSTTRLTSEAVPFAPEWRFIGPPLAAGCFPAVLYFTLSAEHSLEEAPYNEFASALVTRDPNVRVFAVTLPFHGASLAENASAFQKWARAYIDGGDVVSYFARNAAAFGQELVSSGYAESGGVFAAGLSRGGLLAAHVAMRASCIRGLVAFSPVTVLGDLPEFNADAIEGERARSRLERASLLQDNAIAKLSEIPVRFYIGNYDRRVGTRPLFELTHSLAEKAVLDGGVRSPPHELILYCSIGKEGHGTPADVFQDGAKWILNQVK